MKKFQNIMLFLTFGLGLFHFSCRKYSCDDGQTSHASCYNPYPLTPYYTPRTIFQVGMEKTITDIRSNNVYAYLDTLPSGYPDVEGRKTPLADLGGTILEKLSSSNEFEAGVYDIFHFDGQSFSLISYLMKAEMAENISPQTLIDLVGDIPLPPIPQDNFDAPLVVATPDTVANCCDSCRPSIRIRVTWTYKAPCGNYEDTTKGYAANNTLTHMSGGKIYRFDPEVRGCACPGGKWTYQVDAPDGASYGVSSGSSSNGVNLFPQSSGTYKITFTYTVCDKTVTKTFTLGIG
jgi:hypothetical protein